MFFFLKLELIKLELLQLVWKNSLEILAKEKICILKHCRLIKILLMDN